MAGNKRKEPKTGAYFRLLSLTCQNDEASTFDQINTKFPREFRKQSSGEETEPPQKTENSSI